MIILSDFIGLFTKIKSNNLKYGDKMYKLNF